MENKTKLRVLYLYLYLLDHTDPEHPLSTMELTKLLQAEHGIKIARNTICDDLAMLEDSDRHIKHYASTQNKYYYDGQLFDVAELKVLIDAISSSKFITNRKSEELITKLLSMTSAENALRMRRHIYADGQIKAENEKGYDIVDSINEAIERRRKLSFYYSDYDVDRNRYITNNGEPYTVSPYALIWDGDYYYLRCFCDERQAMRNFRLDRIWEKPRILNELSVAPPDGYSPVEYSKAVFRMLDTDEPEQVDLYCHVSTMKYIIDNFGSRMDTQRIDDEHFTARIMVCTSATFYRWVFGFGGKIQILAPDKSIEEYKRMLAEAMNIYKEQPEE